MKIILLLVILIQTQLFTQWQEIERPTSIQTLININSGSDFIIGVKDDPYFSFDGGETWEKRANGLPNDRGPIDKVIVENDIVYILCQVSTSIRKQNIMYSLDKGLNWNKLINNLHFDSYNLISDFAANNGNVYLLPYEGYVMKSSNYGVNWDTLSKWDNSLGYMNLIDVEKDSIVLANKGGIYSNGGTKNASYLISTDGGNSWEQRNTQLSTTGLKCLKIKNKNIYLGGDNGFYYSNDFGLSWRSPGTLVVGAKVNDIEIIRDTVYLATENGLYKAKDLFKGWEVIPFFKGKRVWQIHYGFGKIFTRFVNNDFSNHSSFISELNNFNIFSELNFLSESTLNSFVIDYPRILFASDKIFLKEDLLSDNKVLFETDSVFELSRISYYSENIICTYLPTIPYANNKNIIHSSDNGDIWDKYEFEIDNLNIRDLFLLNNDTLLITDKNLGVHLLSNYKNGLTLFKTNNEEYDNLLQKAYKINRKNSNIYYYGEGVILESDTTLSNWKKFSSNFPINGKINSFSKSNKFIFTISVSGSNIMPSTVDFLFSKDEGNSWTKINDLFPNFKNTVFKSVFNIENYVFVSSSNGIFFSKNNGESWVELNDGLSITAKANGGEFYLYGDKILFCSQSGIFYRDLEELGITLTSVEKTEERNYLYTFPPFPQPTKQEVKISTYWDSALPFTVEDIEIYNLAGIKINTENKLSINKETNYNGHIIWDTSGEQAGIYIVNIKHGTETRTQKVMVME